MSRGRNEKINGFLRVSILVIVVGVIILAYSQGETYLASRLLRRMSIMIGITVIMAIVRAVAAKGEGANNGSRENNKADVWGTRSKYEDFGQFDDETFDAPKKRKALSSRFGTGNANRSGQGTEEEQDKKQQTIFIVAFLAVIAPTVFIYVHYIDGTGSVGGLNVSRSTSKSVLAIGALLALLCDYLVKKIRTRGLRPTNERFVSEIVQASQPLLRGKALRVQHETELKYFFAQLQRKKNNVARIVGDDIDDFARAFHEKYAMQNGIGWFVALCLMSICISAIALHFYFFASSGQSEFFGVQADIGTAILFLAVGAVIMPLYVCGKVFARKKNSPAIQYTITLMPLVVFAYLFLAINIAQYRADIMPEFSKLVNQNVTLFASPLTYIAVIGLALISAVLVAELKKHKTRIYWRGYLKQRAQSEQV